MSEHIQARRENQIGHLTLDRPQALNSLSLGMLRAITGSLLTWRDDPAIAAVIIDSASEKAFCAGGDIRFFYKAAQQTPQQGSALLEDFFTEEYALNHLIHHYPKPYIVFMDGIVMGGGMGIAQARSTGRMRIVTERTRMAMPEVNIGLFPDVGASYFLTRCPGQVGTYMALTGQSIGAADALYAGLADVFLPSVALAGLKALLAANRGADTDGLIRDYAAPFAFQVKTQESLLAQQRSLIDRHFMQNTVVSIIGSLQQDSSQFAQETVATMHKRSPLMLCVTLQQLRHGAGMDFAECLRMERSMMRHGFSIGEAVEGIRATVVDKDMTPNWHPARLTDVSQQMVDDFFKPAWPAPVHPLRCWL